MKETRESLVRSVAVQSERHWWLTRLRTFCGVWSVAVDVPAADLRAAYVEGYVEGQRQCARIINALIAERE